jgi:hypothetical protein
MISGIGWASELIEAAGGAREGSDERMRLLINKGRQDGTQRY